MKKYLVLALHQLGFELCRYEVLAKNISDAFEKASEYFKLNNITYSSMITRNK